MEVEIGSSRRRRPLGWGAGGTSIDRAACASCKTAPAVTPSLDCPKCHLVAYCSEKCRSKDASVHRYELCSSKFASSGWEKALLELLPPALRRCRPLHHIWGNTPASSFLNFKSPPDLNHDGNVVNLCFPASGDFRNVVCTVGELPVGFQGKVNVYINDDDPLVTVRNLLMLELMRMNRGTAAAECVVALWYSSRMTMEQWSGCFAAATSWISCNAGAMDDTIDVTNEPLMKRILKNVELNFLPGSTTTKEKLWGAFSKVTAQFDAEIWLRLFRSMIGMRKVDEPDSVMVARREVFAEHQNRWMVMLQRVSPASRVAWIKFNLENGLLLPMALASEYEGKEDLCDNAFLLRDGTWIQDPRTDARAGWNILDCRKTGREHGVPVGDEIGALFFHVKEKLRRFMEVVEAGSVHFHLSCMDATELAKKLKPIRFHTVATSNIADYLGLKKVLRDWGPMLDADNGTLVTMQKQWFVKGSIIGLTTHEMADQLLGVLGHPKKQSVVPALQRNRAFRGNKAKAVWSRISKTKLVPFCTRTNSAFGKALDSSGARTLAAKLGLEQRMENECIYPRLFVPRGSASDAVPCDYVSSFEELERVTDGAAYTGAERYAEWQVKRKN